MHRTKIISTFLGLMLALVAILLIVKTADRHDDTPSTAPAPASEAKAHYFCPMHPQIVSDRPGACPICHMDLQKKEEPPEIEQASSAPGARKVIFYRDPMGKNVTSPVPMKDSMGMDFIPVYDDEVKAPGQDRPLAGRAPFTLTAQNQQLIGVSKGKVTKAPFNYEIRAAGRVAHDPELYAALQEYRIAAGASQRGNVRANDYFNQESASLLKASKTKLNMMGLNDNEIAILEKDPTGSLDLILPQGQAWVYAEIYENEIGHLQAGQRVDVTASIYPQIVFEGTIKTISPSINTATRALPIRVIVKDPEGKLKHDMFVNVTIKVDLGEQLIIPEDAVINTGQEQLVFVVNSAQRFEPRKVVLGSKGRNGYAVLSGLQEGETVVTSANFLVDSESRLQSVIDQAAKSGKGAQAAP